MNDTHRKVQVLTFSRAVCALLLGLSTLTSSLAQTGIYYSVKLLPNNLTYQVSLSSTIGLSGANQITNSGQVTIVAPAGSFSVASLASTNGTWVNNTTVRAPSQNPGKDYFIFGLTPNAPSIPYSSTQETILFTFANSLPCAGPIEIWTSNDPFQPNPPSQPINVGNDLTALGFQSGGGVSNAWLGNFDIGKANCSGLDCRPVCVPIVITVVRRKRP